MGEGYRDFLDQPDLSNPGIVRGFYERHGLHITKPIRYGSWCGRKDGLSYQDILIATK